MSDPDVFTIRDRLADGDKASDAALAALTRLEQRFEDAQDDSLRLLREKIDLMEKWVWLIKRPHPLSDAERLSEIADIVLRNCAPLTLDQLVEQSNSASISALGLRRILELAQSGQCD